MHKATPRFWSCLAALPLDIQALARKNYALLKEDPQYPPLHFKKVGQFWSVRVGSRHRALAMKEANHFTWVWIGTHAAYNQLVK